MSLFHLARPQLLVYLLALLAGGYGWAHWDRALTFRGGFALVGIAAAWSLLHAGTLWLNAALDRDEGEVLMGRSVPVPPGIAAYGYVALGLAGAVGLASHPRAGLAVVACAMLAVLYSHPRTAWKGHPALGPAVNVVGYGLLTPGAGFLVVDQPVTTRTILMWSLCGVGVLGPYFAAQAFQRAEDAARGYRTLVVTHGPVGAIQASRIAIAAAILGGTALAVAGWLPRPCLVVVPLGAWIDAWYRQWLKQPDGGGEHWARGLARRLLVAGLLTLGVAFVEYVRESLVGEPVAGLGTAAGHPPGVPRVGWAAYRALAR